MSECIEPGKIDKEDIIAYVSEEGTPEVCDHIARCPACRAQADEYTALEKSLLAGLYRLDCPLPETLRAFAAGRLGGPWRRQVSQHVQGCVRCREELEIIRQYDGLAQKGTLGQVIRRLLEVVRAQPLSLSLQPAGLRGIAPAPQLFRAEAAGLDIVLTLLPGEQGGPSQTLVGQLLPYEETEEAQRSFEGAVVELWRGRRILAEATVDDVGGFTLALPGPGKYQVRVYLDDKEIRELWVQV